MANSGDGNGGCCKGCCGFILSSSLTDLFIWLDIRAASDPVCSIQDFYVPALNKTLNSTTNTSISFDLELDNKNTDKGIYYNTLNLTFYVYTSSNQTYFPIANQTLAGFYQGHHKKARPMGTVETTGVPWGEVFGAVSNGLQPVFRVGLVTSFRFKIWYWKTKKHDSVVGADVAVHGSGEKDDQKGVRLNSGAPEMECGQGELWLLVLFC